MASPRRYSPERVIFFLAIVLVVVLNFYLSEIAQNEVAATMPLLPEVVSSRLQQSPTVLKLPTPVFVVGFPKTGTSSIHEFFQCGGIKSSHYCCCGSSRTHTHCNDGGRTFGECMRDNIKSKLPILQGCGDYSVYAQMDAELGNSIFLPQHFKLDLLDTYAPNSTFILNVRPVEDWVKSVSNWFGLGGRFLTRFNHAHKNINRHEVLGEIFQNHTSFIREFVQHHPSHSLVEVDISHPDAGNVLANAFGVDESCWGKHNQNKKRQEI